MLHTLSIMTENLKQTRLEYTDLHITLKMKDEFDAVIGFLHIAPYVTIVPPSLIYLYFYVLYIQLFNKT